jgi:hypothetical protein
LNVTTIINPPQKTQSISSLPLFSWRSIVVELSTVEPVVASTRAGHFVARRYCVDPAVADLIASLAGFAQEAS